MIAAIAGIIGALIGVRTAAKRGGNRADMAQYGVGYGLAFFLLTWLVLLIIYRMSA